MVRKAKLPSLQAQPPMHHRTRVGEQQRARMKARILNAAIKVYGAKGPYQPLIEDFVKAADIGRGTFYYYFDSVAALREEAVARVTDEFAKEIRSATVNLTNPLARFSTAMRLYQRRAKWDPFFAAFVGAATTIGPLLEEDARADLQAAIDQELIKLRDLDVALSIAIAMNQYAARAPRINRPSHLESAKLVQTILGALGVETALIKEALAVSLPRARHRILAETVLKSQPATPVARAARRYRTVVQ